MEPVIPPTVQNKPDHSRRETVVLVIILMLLLVGVGFGLFLTLRPEPVSIQDQARETVTDVPICTANGATCTWSAETGVTSYSYEILDQTTGTVLKKGTTQDTRVSFTPIANHAYKCTVKAVNECGEGASRSTINTCVGVNTPTPTEVPTETPTPTEGETPTPTPTEEITPTPTPTEEITEAPTPVEEVFVVTQTPAPTETIIVEVQPTETPTPSPTAKPPVAGANTGILFMVVSTVILAALMLVF